MRPIIILAVLLPFQCLSTTGDYISRSDDAPSGWHFYDEDPPKPEKEEPPIQKSTTPITSTPIQPSAPAPLSSAWIREQWPKFRDAAIDSPTPENIRRVRLLQRVIMDKSTEFSDAFIQDSINTPLLNESLARPATSFAIGAFNAQQNANRATLLEEIGKKAGLWFFFESDCELCNRQAPLLKHLEYGGLDIQAISIDGPGLVSGLYPNYTFDMGQKHKQLKVARVPALFLVTYDGEFVIPITQGLHTVSEIEELIFQQSKTADLITDTEFNSVAKTQRTNRYQIPNDQIPDAERMATDAAYFNQILLPNE
ncbi:conjugal transfer protein TraF [Vibrio maritimus]|jgi:conjugal transfer pilus assembly protein TraF